MKKSFILIIFIMLICFCAKNIPIDEISINYEDIVKNLKKPYEFNVQIKNDFLDMKYSGRKDALGRLHVKGYIDLIEEQRVVHDAVFDGKNWYEYETGKIINFEQPIDFSEFIFNLVNEADFQAVSSGKLIKAEFNANAALVNPFDYMKKGVAYIDKNNNLKSVVVDDGNLRIDVSLEYSYTIIIDIKKEIVKVLENINVKSSENLNKRLKAQGEGYVEKGKIFLFKDNENFYLTLKCDSMRIGSFEYVDPLTRDDEKYFYMDRKNTAVIKDKIYSFKGDEDILVEKKGPYYDIIVHGISLENASKICVYFLDVCIYADYYENKTLLIKKIPEELIGIVFTIMRYPL